MMHNAPANIETANAADRLETYSLAEPMPQRSGTVVKANRSAIYVVPSWLTALERITAPLLAVTKCNYPRECHTDAANYPTLSKGTE
jgi:hypothetical protein